MTWTHPAYEAVAGLLRERTGLGFAPHRHESAELGMRRAMARSGIPDPEQYRQRLETDGNVLDDLIVELTVGETYFFREPAQFEFIRRTILPELRGRRGGDPGVRIWSAGCASGEEAYSLAIVLHEEGLAERAHLLATDISRAALARAHQAIYSSWSLRGEGAAAAIPYLHRRGDRYLLDEKIRRRVLVAPLNLALDVYPSFGTGTWAMDLILCRNVLIYFDAETVRQVARRLFESLAPGGWLITASSDPPLATAAPFDTVVTTIGVFYRRTIAPVAGARAIPAEPAPAFPQQPPAPASAPLEAGWGKPVESAPLSRTPPRREPEPAAGPSTLAVSPSALAPLAEAQQAFVRGDYTRASALTCDLTTDAAAGALHVRSLANVDAGQAEKACAEAAARHPLSTELHYLHAVLLLDLGRSEEAVRAARRVIYLDRSLAIAHFTLGSILWRSGDKGGARRAYRNARDLCAARPPEEGVPLSDGEHAGRLAAAATAQLALLDATQEVVS